MQFFLVPKMFFFLYSSGFLLFVGFSILFILLSFPFFETLKGVTG